MSNTLHEMTKDMQARIRELAYLMWESAGRQHGMAMEYWLQAEQEVVTTLQAAAERIMPGNAAEPEPAKKKPAKAAPQAAAPEPALKAPAPALASTPAPAPATAKAEPKATAKAEPKATAKASAPAATQKPAARRPASRTKKV